MMPRPFTCRDEDGIRYIALSTPGSSINTLSPEAAAQLTQVLSCIDVTNTRAVVLESSKPGSFINGVSLLRAAAAKTLHDAQTLTGDVRSAYQRLSACPVPTFAAIKGMCFGCGVELALCCRHRLADDSAETRFYMTEINDYLFVPVFEGTLKLPLLLGLERAIEFLLWGKPWTGTDAGRNGLVDVVLNQRTWRNGVSTYVDQILDSPSKLKERPNKAFRGAVDEKVLMHARARIDELPPMLRTLYSDCLGIMERVFRKGYFDDKDRRREFAAAGRSVFKPMAKQALSFFFIRRLAHGVCLRGGDAGTPATQIRLSNSPALREFKADLMQRKLPDLSVSTGSIAGLEVKGAGLALHLQSDSSARTGGATPHHVHRVVVALTLRAGPADRSADAMLYNPSFSTGGLFFELAAARPGTWLTATYEALVRMGYQIIVTHPKGRGFAVSRIVRAFLAPVVRYMLAGGRARTVNYTLRRFGFIRRPHALLAAFGVERSARLLVPHAGTPATEVTKALRSLNRGEFKGGDYDRRLIDAICLSLLAASVRCLEDGTMGHVSLVDLLAREVLDFPLMYGSLCRYLCPPQVRTMVKRRGSFRHLNDDEDMVRAQEFLKSGRRFYL